MKPEELTRKVALYQSTKYGGIFPSEHSGDDNSEYVRLSEPVTITFTERKRDEVMAAVVAGIDSQIVEAQQVVRNLEARKAELLALPAPEAV
jgi:hypothetical protein